MQAPARALPPVPNTVEDSTGPSEESRVPDCPPAARLAAFQDDMRLSRLSLGSSKGCMTFFPWLEAIVPAGARMI